jgi:hypothetical protein
MPPKPKRTASRTRNDAPKRKPSPRRPKAPEPAIELIPDPPAPTRAPIVPPVSERWTIGTALVVVAVALAAVFAAFGLFRLLTGNDRLDLDPGAPTAASASELESYASDHGPVYWIGPPQDGTLEVTRTARGTYVRYLTGGAAVGDKSARYTTVGTYPMRGAYRRIATSARSDGFGSAPLHGGGLAAWNKSAPTSVYLAFPSRPYLVEVYDPSPQRARSLALSGVVQRAG